MCFHYYKNIYYYSALVCHFPPSGLQCADVCQGLFQHSLCILLQKPIDPFQQINLSAAW